MSGEVCFKSYNFVSGYYASTHITNFVSYILVIKYKVLYDFFIVALLVNYFSGFCGIVFYIRK